MQYQTIIIYYILYIQQTDAGACLRRVTSSLLQQYTIFYTCILLMLLYHDDIIACVYVCNVYIINAGIFLDQSNSFKGLRIKHVQYYLFFTPSKKKEFFFYTAQCRMQRFARFLVAGYYIFFLKYLLYT